MTLILIAARSANNVIGKNNTLPWRLPKEMAIFTEKTTGHTVIMGRKTYESIPLKFRPLPNRRNIVISKTYVPVQSEIPEAVEVFESLEAALKTCTGKVFIGGGESLYKEALPLANEIMITEVDCNIEDGTAFFPNFDYADYYIDQTISSTADEKNKYGFYFYHLIKKNN